MKDWFEISKEGLKELQEGKPKTFIVNELAQNCLDEDTTKCIMNIQYSNNQIYMTVEDNSPIGFRDIKDAYTLFKPTYKRGLPEKRGRFNLAEKQILSLCSKAKVETTTGTILFDDDGRHTLTEKRKIGSKVSLWLQATEDDYKKMINHCNLLLIPKGVIFTINNKQIPPKTVCNTFEASLDTEVLQDNVMVTTSRVTKINLVEADGQAYIYEMGIPIMKSDCKWHIDVQQKIPLAVDRETIRAYYVQDLYAVVLNNTYKDITSDESSAVWIRIAMKDERCKAETVKAIMTKRYGEKFCIANPNDKASMDEALSRGYNVIYGSELSKEEWDHIKDTVDIESSTALFGDRNLEEAKPVEPTLKQEQTADYAKRIAKRVLGIEIKVRYVKNPNASMLACYGNRTLTFNVGALHNSFFENPISSKTTDLIIHELGHENGWHVEYDYHRLLTKLGAELTMLALKEPKFFEVN